jgi:hypothetical protein
MTTINSTVFVTIVVPVGVAAEEGTSIAKAIHNKDSRNTELIEAVRQNFQLFAVQYPNSIADCITAIEFAEFSEGYVEDEYDRDDDDDDDDDDTGW